MAESLGSATLTLGANPTPLLGGLAAARAKTVASMRGTGAASAAAFAAGMVALGAAAGVVLYKVGQTYQSAYNKIRTETGATGAKMEGLKDTFRDVFGRTPADAESVATALAEVHKRTGQVGKPLEELTLQFLRLSGATGTDAKTNIAAVTRAFGDWGVATKDQQKKLDGMFALSQKTGISVADLSTKMAQFGTPLRTLGFSFDQAAAMFSLFEKTGVTVTTMMPGLRMALKNIAKPTDELAGKFKTLGVDTKDPQAALGTIMETIKKMPNATDAASFAMEVFGTRAGPDMAGAIREGKFEVSDLVKVMKNSNGAIEENAAATATLKGRLEILKHRGMNLLEPVAMKLTDALTNLAGKLLDLSEWFQNLPQPIRDTVGKVVMFAGGLAILLAMVAKVRTALLAMNAVLLLNPYVLIAAATVAIAYLVIKHWDKIKAALSAAWDAIKSGLSAAWKAIRGVFAKNWKLLILIPLGPLGILTALIVKNWQRIREFTAKIWGAIRDVMRRLIGAARDAVMSIVQSIRERIVTAWSLIRSLTGTIWRTIRTLIVTPLGVARDAVSSIASGIRSAISSAWNTIRSVTGTVWGAIKTRMVNPIAAAYSAIVGILSALKTVVLSAWNYVTEKIADLWSKIKGLPSKINPFSAAVSSSAATSAVSSPAITAAGITSDPGAAATLAGPGAPVNVAITFADGMGWLRDFVDVRIQDAESSAARVYLAGAAI